MITDSDRVRIAQANSEKNMAEILASPIMGRAGIKWQDGQVQIVAVFSQSTRAEFYWVFTAEDPYSPYETWKLINTFNVRAQLGPTPLYEDLTSFVTWLAGTRIAPIQSMKVNLTAELEAVTLRPEHESIRFSWEEKTSQAGSTNNIANRNLHRKMGASGRWDENWVIRKT